MAFVGCLEAISDFDVKLSAIYSSLEYDSFSHQNSSNERQNDCMWHMRSVRKSPGGL